MKQHLRDHPAHGTVISMALTVSMVAGAAYGYDDVTPTGKMRAKFVLDEVYRAIRAQLWPQMDVLETKLARGDKGQDVLDMIDRALASIGDSMRVVSPLIQAAFNEAERKFPG
jgi:hypothetical protein